MFDSIQSAFSDFTKRLGEREVREKDVDETLDDLEIALLESDVALEVVTEMKANLKERLVGTIVNKKEVSKFIRDGLIECVSGIFDRAGTRDLTGEICSKDAAEPYVIVFVGINGTGKTTSLAKVAKMLQDSRISVVIAAADTFRAGAIEQLREHANRLNLKIVAQNYGADPAAVARDAVLYARSHKVDCVLVDTAGRMQTSRNLMSQITKIVSVVNPDMKIFVGDSLAGNDTVNQAREFYERIKFDAAILAKSDADARGGAALSISGITSAPILYVGVGQEYEDLKPFNKQVFLKTVFGDVNVRLAENAPEETQKIPPPSTEVVLEVPVRPPPEAGTEPALPHADGREDTVAGKVVIPHESPKLEDDDTPAAIAQEEPGETPDPFEGIATDDINAYIEIRDEPPPETDEEAREVATRIREWIALGRPDEDSSSKSREDAGGKRSGKAKKRRSIFGILRR